MDISIRQCIFLFSESLCAADQLFRGNNVLLLNAAWHCITGISRDIPGWQRASLLSVPFFKINGSLTDVRASLPAWMLAGTLWRQQSSVFFPSLYTKCTSSKVNHNFGVGVPQHSFVHFFFSGQMFSGPEKLAAIVKGDALQFVFL